MGALPIRQVEKPWGRSVLPAPFAAPSGGRIGEIWFEPPAEVPDLLVKYIFTSEKLSVQVHPSDAQTLANGMGRQGKEECWLIIDAEPGARLGIGLDSAISGEALRAAALDGSIEALMTWHPVKAGDFFYIPANTIHAIGAGVSLIEVQQNSDITYRLFDYGRPRALHLDEAVTVASAEPYDLGAWHTSVPARAAQVLVDGPLFQVEQVAGVPGEDTVRRFSGPLLVIPREGQVVINGEPVLPGGCGRASRLRDIVFASGSVCLLARTCPA